MSENNKVSYLLLFLTIFVRKIFMNIFFDFNKHGKMYQKNSDYVLIYVHESFDLLPDISLPVTGLFLFHVASRYSIILSISTWAYQNVI